MVYGRAKERERGKEMAWGTTGPAVRAEISTSFKRWNYFPKLSVRLKKGAKMKNWYEEILLFTVM